MEEYEARGGLPLSEIFEQPEEVRDVIAQSFKTIYPDFTLESEEQFEDWRDNRFHMHNRAPPEVTAALKEDNTQYWVIGGVLALVLLTYK